MFIAIDENNMRSDAMTVSEKGRFYCPICNSEVRIRKGQFRVAHFAHISVKDCDTWSSDMSEWHRDWQAEFPVDCREIVVRSGEVVHRADVKIGNTVIEFQHSKISKEEYWERNDFYNKCGYQVIWLFDLSEEYEKQKISLLSDNKHFSDEIYAWKYRWHTFDGYSLRDHGKRVEVFFQFHDDDNGENQGIKQLLYTGKTGTTEKTVVFSKQNSYIKDMFVNHCINNVVSKNLFPPEDAVDLEKEKVTVGDLMDILKSHKSRLGNSPVVDCPKTNREEFYENCEACGYNGRCNLNNEQEKMIGEELSRKYMIYRESISSYVYFEACTYCFLQYLEEWNIYRDRVLDIKRENGRITYAVMQIDGMKKVYKVDPKEPVPMSIPRLLQLSFADCIAVCNVRTGMHARVSRRNQWNTIKGVIKHKDARSFSTFRVDIPDAYDNDWVLD